MTSEPPSTYSIHILNPLAYPVADSMIERAVAATLASEAAPSSDVRVLLTDESGITDLNRKFRRLDEATDVLTFPEGEGASGDIAVCVPYAERQARERGIERADEIVLLAVHGALHLVGFDDESDDDRAEMIRRMNRIAVQLGMRLDGDWSSLLHGAV